MARAPALAVVALVVGVAGYVVADPGVAVRFHAAGELTSETNGFSGLELRLRMLASLGYFGDIVSGSVRCSIRPGQLACPGATGKISGSGGSRGSRAKSRSDHANALGAAAAAPDRRGDAEESAADLAQPALAAPAYIEEPLVAARPRLVRQAVQEESR